MTLAEYRRTCPITLEACAVELGLKPSTKGFLSRIENGEVPAPMRLALQIQAWSKGAVSARDLVSPEDRQLLDDAAAATPAEAVA